MEDRYLHRVKPRGDDNGDVYGECDNIIQVFMDVNIAVFWVVIPYGLVGI